MGGMVVCWVIVWCGFVHVLSTRTWLCSGVGYANNPQRVLGVIGGWLFGGVLLSHTVSSAVPSALKGLASGFGMLPGVSPSLWPPKRCRVFRWVLCCAFVFRPYLGNCTVDA